RLPPCPTLFPTRRSSDLRLRRLAQVVEDQAGLDARESPLRIDLDELVQVLREVDGNRDVAGLAGETRARAVGEHRRAIVAADAQDRKSTRLNSSHVEISY